MTKQKIEIEIDVPEGYVATGEYRHETESEHYMDNYGNVCLRGKPYISKDRMAIILKPTPPELDDRELREALDVIEEMGCDVTLDEYPCDKCVMVERYCPADWTHGESNAATEHWREHRTEILAEAARLKQQRKDEEIAKERERVVGKWCLCTSNSFENHKRGAYAKVKDYARLQRFAYTVEDGGMFDTAIPLTPDQLTALNLEND